MKESTIRSDRDRSLKRLRLAARIIATLFTLFCLLLLVDGIRYDIRRNGTITPPNDWLGFAVVVSLFIGFLGLFIAYWREGVGALISCIGFLSGAIFLIIDPLLSFSVIYFIIMIPTIMYFIYWNENRKIRIQQYK